jgi:hypothetical protein
LFRRILTEPDFLRGEIHTKWLDELLRRPRSGASAPPGSNEDASSNRARDAAAIAAAIWQATQSPVQSSAGSTADETPSRWKMEGRRELLDRTP